MSVCACALHVCAYEVGVCVNIQCVHVCERQKIKKHRGREAEENYKLKQNNFQCFCFLIFGHEILRRSLEF